MISIRCYVGEMSLKHSHVDIVSRQEAKKGGPGG